MEGLSRERVEAVFNERVYDAQDNWKLKCPIHGENTPSFFIHKTDLITHCFGCGIAGPVETIAALYMKCPEQEARTRLGISGDLLMQSRKKREDRGRRTFPESWLAPWKKIKIHPLLTERGFDEELLRVYVPRWDAGQKRIVFPLRNEAGQLVGASGRRTDFREPKWYFYWDCHRGDNLYRCPDLHDSPQEVFVVEGIFDIIAYHKAGLCNVVSLLSSTVTARQAIELKALAPKVIVALDNDKAGHRGTDRLFRALRKACIVRSVIWPKWANDACDLSPDQLRNLPIETYLERQLNGRAGI